MSDQQLRIDTFNSLFFDFLNDLSVLFPNDRTLSFCKSSASAIRMVDAKFIVKEFKAGIAPFTDRILKKDEEYFMKSEFVENFGNDHYIINEINRVINIWKDPNTTKDTKKMVWDYVLKLTKLSKTIN
jgi:hypothetical protein